MNIRAFGKTDIGIIRENNEDNFLIMNIATGEEGDIKNPTSTEDGILLLVTDGMGGAVAGETASLIMVTESAKYMRANKTAIPEAAARECLLVSHDQCHRMIKLNPGLMGMGTVATVVVLKRNRLSISQIGDTRLYIYRNKTLLQITEDQNFVSELVRLGIITPEQAMIHPQRNAVTQAIGSIEPIIPVDYSENVQAGDKILLCSDGLNGMISDLEMQLLLESSNDLEVVIDNLIDAAKDSGGHDNITVILAEVTQ
ncbi:MAG: serine/threonine-protein phosphatase [Leptospiraceae bacterium]|nr:serine/threonine-protein phosphatase [Leptospiraceae bacterium]